MTKIACVFPGQGSQTVGMLAEHAITYPQVQETFSEASEALGYDLWDLVQNDDSGRLNQTEVTQPALLTASVAIWRTLSEQQRSAVEVLAGHSLGEYSALVCAGVLDFKDAVKLVEARGQFMQEAVPAGTGAMYAIIGLDDDKIQDICATVTEQTGQIVAAVNFNSPGQVVIAGNKEAAEKAGEACKEAGAKRALPLPVSVPSHCALMKPAAEKLAGMLATISFSEPEIPVINNVDVMMETSSDAIKDALIRQLYSPVRWTETIQLMAEQGVENIYEIGPGKVLTGLTKRIEKRISGDAVNTPDALTNAF